nr:MAG TPA: hypothetical protein [Caudoviricetes sp.]
MILLIDNIEEQINVNSAKLIKLIEADGWYLQRIKGSHHHFKHDVKKGIVTIPHPEKDMHPKTEQSILKQAGLK